MFNRISRENDVLQLIVTSYVNTANPVSSRVISKRLNLSSATIRNVMQDLEEQGFILQPHASAGRIPTEKGYRYYIDSLLQLKRLTEKQIHFIETEYRNKLRSLEMLLEQTSHILSLITNCAGITIFPKIKERSFRHISFVPIAGKRILVLLVTSSGYAKDFLIETSSTFHKDELQKISNFLNSELYEMTLSDIKRYLVKQLNAERASTYQLLKKSLDVVSSVMISSQGGDLYLDGTSHILSQPEFKDHKKLSSVLRFLENKKHILHLLLDEITEEGLRVHIGRENKLHELREFSVVTKEYTFKERICGRLGVIGLTRMDYERIIPIVDYLADRVSKALSEWEL